MSTRRQVLLASLSLPLAAAATYSYSRFEATDLRTRQLRCAIPGLEKPLRLVHLTDLHASPVVPLSLIEEAVQRTARIKPDLICVTGDFVTSRGGFDRNAFRRILSALPQIAPTFATMGNHDGGYWSWTLGSGFRTSEPVRDLVCESGLQLLHNRSTSLLGLQLVGLGDLWAQEFDPPAAFQSIDRTRPVVVLSHNPDSKDGIDARPWNLMLSGHTHGGQVVMPVFDWAPCVVRDTRYLRGLRRYFDRWVHVSAGVGNAHGLRFNCPPDITLLNLVPA